MLKIWGRISSVNVQKVVWAAGEVGQPFERVDAGGAFGLVGEPAYRAKNPNGLIPVLEDGDTIIWESAAIVRYLCARYGAGWVWPEDPVRRAESDRWMDWTNTELQPAMGPAFMGLIRTPEGRRDMAAIEASVARTEARLDILDRHLATRDHLGGQGFDMADIVVAPGVHRWLMMPVSRVERPRLEAWYARVAARPAAGPALPAQLS